jgi:hypothetical protein
MPTTRRGRFLHYKKRQRRRLRRCDRRYSSDGTGGMGRTRHETQRAFDLSGFDKQQPRTYPIRERVYAPVPSDSVFWRVPPSAGVFGVPDLPFVQTLWPYPPAHPRGPIHNYYEKRMKSVPRLKYIPKKPYLFPPGAVPVEKMYPGQFYPSGQPNPHWTPPEP